MIPKKIHYIWVGDQEKPELVQKCIKSWVENLPDYEIIEWNNDILQEINNRYVLEAIHAKKWAFVSDYLRLYALYHQGGIYLDTDILITQSLSPFLNNDFFIGSEPYKKKLAYPMTAVIGAVAHNEIILDLLKTYNNSRFINNEGKQDLTTNPVRFADYFLNSFGLKYPYKKDVLIHLKQKSKIYPTYYFCNSVDNKINYSIHLFNGSWLDSYSRKNKLKILNYRLVKFKKRHCYNNVLPLQDKEIILYRKHISKNCFYAITKITNEPN